MWNNINMKLVNSSEKRHINPEGGGGGGEHTKKCIFFMSQCLPPLPQIT